MNCTVIELRILLPHFDMVGNHTEAVKAVTDLLETLPHGADSQFLRRVEMDVEPADISKAVGNWLPAIDDLPESLTKTMAFMAVVRDDEDDLRFSGLYKSEEAARYAICKFIDDPVEFPDVKTQDVGRVRNATNWERHEEDGDLIEWYMADEPYGGWRMAIIPMEVED